MSDTKTSAEWRIVAIDQQANANDFTARAATLTTAIKEDQAFVASTSNNLRALESQGRAGTKEYAALNRLVTQYRTSIQQNTVERNRLLGDAERARASAAEANKQAEIARGAPVGSPTDPVTSSNPPPVNPAPGNNTDVASTASIVNGEPSPIVTQPSPLSTDGNLPDQVPDGVADLSLLGVNTALPTDLEQELYGNGSVQGGVTTARSSGNEGRLTAFPEALDYRVRVSLSSKANYLYMEPGITSKHLLYPLLATNGVIYPYTPTIGVTYAASYSATDITHSNFNLYNYNRSYVESVTITGDFTAQDSVEATYVLAVMHFYRSVTKMFYGLDQQRGVPPPLVYLSGHGEYGFDNHPMVITNFTLTYPNDCDYINAGPTYNVNAEANPYTPPNFINDPSRTRLSTAKLQPGGVRVPPSFGVQSNTRPTGITRVPSKLQIVITASPVVTRDTISNKFSLKDYASGELLRGSKTNLGGGVW